MKAFALLLLFALAGCDSSREQEMKLRTARQTAFDARELAALNYQRFSLVPVSRGGRQDVFRIDTTTGEVWRYDGLGSFEVVSVPGNNGPRADIFDAVAADTNSLRLPVSP
ncbi:MAG TPA: hypothetical protein VGF13_16620 [Verrucomicrobiae bacterium]|jgi:hypothetical protein